MIYSDYRILLTIFQRKNYMSLLNLAKGTAVEEIVSMLNKAEKNGANMYYVLVQLAKEKGYDDLAEAMLLNAQEDALHGGRYGAMLGESKADSEDAFWQMVISFYKAEAGAKQQLEPLAEKAKAAGQMEIADLIAESIPEEELHAERLEAILKKYNKI